jgi:hypothetical protein
LTPRKDEDVSSRPREAQDKLYDTQIVHDGPLKNQSNDLKKRVFPEGAPRTVAMVE